MIDRYSTPEMKVLWSEANRYRSWLVIELAVTEAWEASGDVPQGTTTRIHKALEGQELDEGFAERVAEIESTTKHDIVAFTRALTERIGDDAKYIHLGLTSTDVVDSAQNLILREACTIILKDLEELAEALKEKAVTYRHTPCIGRTHGIHAEPMTFGLKFLNFYANLQRDKERLERASESLRVVMLSGSIGTYAHIPPNIEEKVAEKLGLIADPVTNQTVARDRHAEFMNALALMGTTLERIAVEIRHLQRTEVREAQEGFSKGQTGSSSMPHKKNPISTENISGVARLLRSNAQAALENVVLWHERDISHSSTERIILPDSTTLASYATRRMTRVIKNLVVYPENMLKNINALHGLVYSQRVLHKLIDAGMMREQAYDVVQRNSLKSWENQVPLKELIRQDPESPLDEITLEAAFDIVTDDRYEGHAAARTQNLELGWVVFDTRQANDDPQKVHWPPKNLGLCASFVNLVDAPLAATTDHVLNHDLRIARNVFVEVLDERLGVTSQPAAGARRYDDFNGLAFKILGVSTDGQQTKGRHSGQQGSERAFHVFLLTWVLLLVSS